MLSLSRRRGWSMRAAVAPVVVMVAVGFAAKAVGHLAHLGAVWKGSFPIHADWFAMGMALAVLYAAWERRTAARDRAGTGRGDRPRGRVESHCNEGPGRRPARFCRLADLDGRGERPPARLRGLRAFRRPDRPGARIPRVRRRRPVVLRDLPLAVPRDQRAARQGPHTGRGRRICVQPRPGAAGHGRPCVDHVPLCRAPRASSQAELAAGSRGGSSKRALGRGLARSPGPKRRS